MDEKMVHDSAEEEGKDVEISEMDKWAEVAIDREVEIGQDDPISVVEISEAVIFEVARWEIFPFRKK